jgi:hypothetical protein
MRLALTRTQSLILLATIVVFLAVGFLPTFGPPHFRYTGSVPDHHVWNLGWPLATCILDTDTKPYFFVGPFAYLWLLALLGSVLTLTICMLAWNNRATLRTRLRRATIRDTAAGS